MLEPLYTGKALPALTQAVDTGHFATGQRLVSVHRRPKAVGGGSGGMSFAGGRSSVNLSGTDKPGILAERNCLSRSLSINQ